MRGVAVALVLFLFILLSVHEAVLQAAGDFLAVEDPLHRADAIIAISGDGQERVRAASELLRRGLGRWLILSGGPGGGSGSARQLLDYAYEVGVPDDRILVDDGATSTTGNARGSADLMRRKGLRSAILVTSPYHMRRSAVIFRAYFRPQGLTVSAYPVRDSFFQVQGWWRRAQDRGRVIREYEKLFAFLIGVR